MQETKCPLGADEARHFQEFFSGKDTAALTQKMDIRLDELKAQGW